MTTKQNEAAEAKRAVLKHLREQLTIARRWSRDGVYKGWARQNRERARLLSVAIAAVRRMKSGTR